MTADASPVLESISAEELQRKDIPPIRWIVKDLLPAGLTLLASPPKFGKSWAVLQMGLSVVFGGTFLGYQCIPSEVLYLALEDSERRLKGRMGKILGRAPAPSGFRFSTACLTLEGGLVPTLEAHLRQYPATGLVIVDTLQKVRDLGGGRDVYGKDYADAGALKRFADLHNIAVLLVHHLRKMGDDTDPFARISGTNGLSGAADTMLVLAKARRNEDTATLSVTGRDVEQMDLVLCFNKTSCLWDNLGDADAFAVQQARLAYRDNPIVHTVKTLLEQHPDGWDGTAQQLLEAGQYIARTPLAESARALTGKLKGLDKLLLEYDGIAYTYRRNGSGGGKHKFSYLAAPQPEELDQTEMAPLPLG